MVEKSFTMIGPCQDAELRTEWLQFKKNKKETSTMRLRKFFKKKMIVSDKEAFDNVAFDNSVLPTVGSSALSTVGNSALNTPHDHNSNGMTTTTQF